MSPQNSCTQSSDAQISPTPTTATPATGAPLTPTRPLSGTPVTCTPLSGTIDRRAFAKAVAAAAIVCGATVPFGANLAAFASPAPRPPYAPPDAPPYAPQSAASPATSPASPVPDPTAASATPGLTAARQAQVRGFVERDARLRAAMRPMPLPYTLEPAFVFSVRAPERARRKP